jgi:hypothetical protein
MKINFATIISTFVILSSNLIFGIEIETHPRVLSRDQDIPTSGRYFYVDFHMGTRIGQHYAVMDVGSQNANMSVWITTSTPLMGLSGSNCNSCGVQTKYNQKASSTSKIIHQNIYSDNTDYFNRKELKTVQYLGNMV